MKIVKEYFSKFRQVVIKGLTSDRSLQKLQYVYRQLRLDFKTHDVLDGELEVIVTSECVGFKFKIPDEVALPSDVQIID